MFSPVSYISGNLIATFKEHKMEKFCPNCGKKLSVNANFCPECGYNFSQRRQKVTADKTASRVKRSETLKGKNRKPIIVLICVIVVILILFGGFMFFERHNDSSTTQSAESSKTYSRTRTSDSSNESSKNEKGSSKKLSTDMGPKETAAAITYYAAKDDIEGWSSAIKGDSLTVDLSTDDSLLDSLSATGQGMAYIISDSSSDNKLVYTIDKDDTVNIYSLPDDYDQEETYDPVKSIAKSDLIQSLNDDNYGDAVEKLKNNVEINQ